MNARTVARGIWLILIASVFVYPVVAYVVPIRPSGVPVGALLKALYAAAAIAVAAAVLIRRQLLSPNLVEKYTKEPLARHGVSVTSERGRDLARFYATQWVLKVNITCWAVAESISILGLVAALISGRFSTILPFSVATLLLLLRMRPDFSFVEALVPGNDPYR